MFANCYTPLVRLLTLLYCMFTVFEEKLLQIRRISILLIMYPKMKVYDRDFHNVGNFYPSQLKSATMHPSAGTKLYCLVTLTEAHACEQLAKGCYLKARFEPTTFWVVSERSTVKSAFHDTDIDTDSPDALTSLRPTNAILSRGTLQGCRCRCRIPRHRHGDTDILARILAIGIARIGVVECNLYATQATNIDRPSLNSFFANSSLTMLAMMGMVTGAGA